MSLTIELPDEALARLEAEATRRGITVDDLVADFAGQLPGRTAATSARRLSFVGIGASGRTNPTDAKAERGQLARDKLAKGI